MPDAPALERYQPGFFRFPIQNNRTGYKPVYLPMILVVPGRRTAQGTGLQGSGVFNVKFYVTDAPDPAIVAGQFIFPPPSGVPIINNVVVPQLERFVVNISTQQLQDVQLDPSSRQFYNTDGDPIDFEDAEAGDSFEYTLIRGNTSGRITYYPDADYHDMSLFLIDVEDLPRPKHYLFVWQAQYYRRVVLDSFVTGSGTIEPFCINQSDVGTAQYSIDISHPGEIHEEMRRKTPPFYFDENNFKKSDDPVLEFYRPFADALQDVFDEQTFINGINHIDNIPAQLIPYLSFLIGWDLPNYPGVTDNVRRSILRQAVKLQQLKGSRRAISELFQIFGYTIDIVNLWYATDGSQFVAPNERLPDTIQNNEITQELVCQIDPLVADYSTAGFGEFEVPLIYPATDDMTVTAIQVLPGPSYNALQQLIVDSSSNPDVLVSSCQRTSSGFLMPTPLLDRLPDGDPTLLALTDVLVDFRTGEAEQIVSTTTVPLLNVKNVTYDNYRNVLRINFDRYFDFADGSKIFIFVTYPRNQIIVPEAMKNLRSNRFDLQILNLDGIPPGTATLELLLNFVFNLKAFHSLLRKLVFNLGIDSVYNVQDYCSSNVGLQIPPAIIPVDPTACDPLTATRGYKEADLALRRLVYNSLVEENKGWRNLDNTHPTDPTLEHYLNISSRPPIGTECQFTAYGQDRVVEEDKDFDHVVDDRERICEDSPTVQNCFKGRVQSELVMDQAITLAEFVHCRPCGLGYGSGYYWTYPANATSNLRPGFGQYPGQNLTSFLGSKIRRYNHPLPKSLHYTNRSYLLPEQVESNELLAYRRTSLEVQKDNMMFSGHRFAFARNMVNDFTHPDWLAKPWDNPLNRLNARLAINTDGDEYLIYDNAPLVYEGNGLEPDISSFGSHEGRPYVVTHKVYMTADPSHPAITLDERIVLTQETEINLDSSVPFGGIFKTYNPECQKDYISGYPAVYNEFEVDVDEIGPWNYTWSSELLEALGVPHRAGSANSTGTINALFTYGSGILLANTDSQYQYYEPFRYDCGCGLFPCSTDSGSTGSNTSIPINSCSLNFYQLPDGTYDFKCDQLEVIPRVKLTESLGVCNIKYDGTIPNSICMKVMTTDGATVPDDIPPVGSFLFRDEYDTIYEGKWTYDVQQGIMDVTWSSKNPHVWGSPDEGYLDGRVVYRRGIVTTAREVYLVEGSSYTELFAYSEQRIDFFRTNDICGEPKPIDNFCYHFDCAVDEEVEFQTTCGPRWVDPNDGTDQPVEWPELVLDSDGNVTGVAAATGVQPFMWVDVWGNNDNLVSVCP